MNFLRRLVGRGQDAANSTMDQATVAARDPGARLAEGAVAASNFAASAPAGTATGGSGGGTTDLASELNPESLGKFSDAIQQLGPEQLQSAAKNAIDKMPESTKIDLFSKAQSYLEQRGTSTAQSTAVAEHDSGALSQVLAGVMKEGPSSLSDLFNSGGSGGATAASGGGGAGIGGLVNDAAGALGGEGGGFAALLSNPLARQVLAFLVPAVIGALSKR
ncbi:MAG TPA: hypothetical protein VFL82_07995 [Thermomicrobiales bacterium]|nr:hypothetical protein [Thermomicrobiales bacterium]